MAGVRAAGQAVIDWFFAAIEKVKQKVIEIKDAILGKIDIKDDLRKMGYSEDTIEHIYGNKQEAGLDDLRSDYAHVQKNDAKVAAQNFSPMNFTADALGIDRGALGPSAPTGPMPAQGGRDVWAPSVAASITVQIPPGGNADEYGRKIADAFKTLWTDQVRGLAAVTGGKAAP